MDLLASGLCQNKSKDALKTCLLFGSEIVAKGVFQSIAKSRKKKLTPPKRTSKAKRKENHSDILRPSFPKPKHHLLLLILSDLLKDLSWGQATEGQPRSKLRGVVLGCRPHRKPVAIAASLENEAPKKEVSNRNRPSVQIAIRYHIYVDLDCVLYIYHYSYQKFACSQFWWLDSDYPLGEFPPFESARFLLFYKNGRWQSRLWTQHPIASVKVLSHSIRLKPWEQNRFQTSPAATSGNTKRQVILKSCQRSVLRSHVGSIAKPRKTEAASTIFGRKQL